MTIALRLDLAPQVQAIVAPFLPAVQHVGSIGVKVTVFPPAPLPLRDTKSEPPTNRAIGLAEPAGDRLWFEPQRSQGDDLFVALHPFSLSGHLELLPVRGHRRPPRCCCSGARLFFCS